MKYCLLFAAIVHISAISAKKCAPKYDPVYDSNGFELPPAANSNMDIPPDPIPAPQPEPELPPAPQPEPELPPAPIPAPQQQGWVADETTQEFINDCVTAHTLKLMEHMGIDRMFQWDQRLAEDCKVVTDANANLDSLFHLDIDQKHFINAKGEQISVFVYGQNIGMMTTPGMKYCNPNAMQGWIDNERPLYDRNRDDPQAAHFKIAMTLGLTTIGCSVTTNDMTRNDYICCNFGMG